MSHTQPGRRRFLKKSATAAGLVASSPALALAATSASAEAPPPAAVDNNSLESVLYGRRSRFVTTTREIEGRSHSTTPADTARPPAAERPYPAGRAGRDDHADVTPFHDAALLRHPRHQPGRAHPHD